MFHFVILGSRSSYVEYSHSKEYEQKLLLRYIHHFESGLNNNMDHMRIFGIEPYSVILSQTK